MQPPRPMPKAPPRHHPRFAPDALLKPYAPQRGGADLFFCHGLPAGSPEAKIMAAAAGDRPQDLAALLAAHSGITPDFANAHGLTPLMVAAARGQRDVINVLANHALVDMSQATSDGWSALHYAAYFNQTAAVETLLRRQADPMRENADGKMPYDMAQATDTRAAFLQHKIFSKFIKRRDAAAAPVIPANDSAPPVTAPAEKTAAPAPDDIPSLSNKFMQAALNIGVASAKDSLYTRLEKDIAAGRIDRLRESYDIIVKAEVAAFERGQSISFDWDKLFVTAARHGNMPALGFIAEKRNYLDSKPLTEALRAAISPSGTGDPDVVHWLLRWGADANASSQPAKGAANATLGYAAFALERTQAFEQICLWGGDLKSWRMDDVQLNWELRVKHAMANGQETSLDNITEARTCLKLLHIRRDYASAGEGKIRSHFKTAVQNKDLPAVMAIYAESRTARIMRSAVALPTDEGAAAMALALRAGKTTFATRLAADGHHIKHLKDPYLLAAMDILEKGAPSPVRDFLTAHKNGTLALPPNTSVSEKFKELRALAARTAPSARGYGI